MEEKTIIVGKLSKKTSTIPLMIGAVCLVIGLVLYAMNINQCRIYERYDGTLIHHSFFHAINPTASNSVLVWAISDIGIIAIIVGIIFYFAVSKVSITVTDKRVYGTATWGKRVDLPFDSISAVAIAMFNTIAVATSSGSIKFSCIENYDEVHKEISKLLVNRQKEKTNTVIVEKETKIGNDTASELKKFNELLKEGIITQEEVDAKKKQLLGL